MYWRQRSAFPVRRGPRRWLEADLVDLVEVSREGDAPAAGTGGDASFDRDMRRLRRRILRRWALAAAARYALVALAAALLPAALAALGLIDWAWAVGIAATVFVVALAGRLSRPPSLERVARLVDDRLGLFDVTATALQVERSGESTDAGPGALVILDAAAVLRGAASWRARARIGRWEVGGAAVLVAALVVLALVGNGPGSAGRAAVTARANPAGTRGHKTRMTNVSPPLVPAKAKRPEAKGDRSGPEHRSPLGLYDLGFEGKRPLPKVNGGGHVGLRSHGSQRTAAGPRSFAAQSPGGDSEAREKAEEKASGGTGADASAAGEKRQGGEGPESLKSLTGGKAPPTGAVRPVPGSTPGAQASTKAAGGAGAGGSSGARDPSGAAGSPRGGRPSGSASAGHGRAALGAGTEGREGGGTGGALPLRAGFAAVRSGKAAGGRGPRNAQGAGGPGRSAGIAGSAFEESSAGSLGYVPPDAGVAAGLDPGLFTRYLNALAEIGGRRW
jgi:hypothetical protein